uniref:Mirror-image polydactyly 1 n=1 Tax=Jaculus jaculus TaxID=51337 RepID=A0A8C5K3W0_JACJA
MNPVGNLHQKVSEFGNEVICEDTELPGQRSRRFQVISPHSDDKTPEKCNNMEYREDDLSYESVLPHQATLDINKETTVAFLLKELEILRLSNKKLQENLIKEDKEHRKLKLKLDLQEKATEAKIAEKTALENINPEENDMTLQELLNRINNADTGRAIQKNGAIIVDRIYKTKECKKRITAEEMNAVIEERDAALSQCKRLEQELHHLKEQKQTSANNMRHLTAENNQERALKAKLLSMQQARETAVEQYKMLEEEIQTLRVYYSLHKSLSQEENLKDQFNHTLSTYEEALKNRESIVSITQQQNEELATQLQQALTDKANVESQLQCALEASQVANEKVQKLERLVDVLRKKVGTGTVRTVI